MTIKFMCPTHVQMRISWLFTNVKHILKVKMRQAATGLGLMSIFADTAV